MPSITRADESRPPQSPLMEPIGRGSRLTWLVLCDPRHLCRRSAASAAGAPLLPFASRAADHPTRACLSEPNKASRRRADIPGQQAPPPPAVFGSAMRSDSVGRHNCTRSGVSLAAVTLTPFPWASMVTNGSAKAESQLSG